MIRIGHGYDIHRFESQRSSKALYIGGVIVPHDRGVIAHSDGDVVLHAVCDALLGALALGDLGTHFPDNDPRFKGVASRFLLQEIVDKVTAHAYQVGNIDVTILLEVPKLSPYRAEIQANLAGLLAISEKDVSIKAKTKEGVDAIGERRAIAAHVIALLFPRGRL